MSRHWVVCGLAAFLAVAAAGAFAGTIDDDLEQILAASPPNEIVSTLVYLRDRVDVDALNATLDGRRATRAKPLVLTS